MKLSIDVTVKGGLPLIAEATADCGEIFDVTLHWARKPYNEISDNMANSIPESDWADIHDRLRQEYEEITTTPFWER